MKTTHELNPLHDAIKQFVRESRILGVQKHGGGIELVTDAKTASLLDDLGLASKHIGRATRAALSDASIELGDKQNLITWEGDRGLINAFGNIDNVMHALNGISLVPYSKEVVAKTFQDMLKAREAAQRGGRAGTTALSTPRGR